MQPYPVRSRLSFFGFNRARSAPPTVLTSLDTNAASSDTDTSPSAISIASGSTGRTGVVSNSNVVSKPGISNVTYPIDSIAERDRNMGSGSGSHGNGSHGNRDIITVESSTESTESLETSAKDSDYNTISNNNTNNKNSTNTNNPITQTRTSTFKHALRVRNQEWLTAPALLRQILSTPFRNPEVSLSLTLSLSHTHSLSQSISLTHSHTHTHTHAHT